MTQFIFVVITTFLLALTALSQTDPVTTPKLKTENQEYLIFIPKQAIFPE
ncbi:MAG: hypothetical protein V7767_13570 [Leeuwenhoekiella sp.]